MKKILVTGGAGFIGSHLVQKLIDNGFKVMIVDSLKTTGGLIYINPKSYFVKGDILDSKTLKKIRKWKPKIIYHLAAQSGGETAYDNPKYDYLTNGYGTYLLSELAREIKVEQFIYTSSVAVYGSNVGTTISEKTKINPDSIYGISKYAGEMFLIQNLRNTKIKTIIFRIFNTYGPGEDLNYFKKGMVSIYCGYVWKKKPILVKGSINRFRNYQFIDDVISILFQSINNKKLKMKEIINLTSGKSTKVSELLKLILKEKNYKKYKIIEKNKGTPGDSFGYHATNLYLLKKFNNFKFTSIKKGLEKYFKWINAIPVRKNIKRYHPLNQKNKREI